MNKLIQIDRFAKKWKIAKFNLALIFLAGIFQILGCTPLQQAQSNNPTLENNKSNTTQVEVNKIPNKIIDPDLEKNHRLWLEQKILNYDMVCSLADGPVTGSIKPVLIKVRDGKAISMEQVDKIQHPSIENYRKFNTVEKIFDEIQKAHDNSANLLIKVGYNKKLGYPEAFGVADNKVMDKYEVLYIDKFEIK